MATDIRKARKEDMKRVLEMIQELARFEKMEDQCQMTIVKLEQDGFGTMNPAFHCLVAELPDGKVVGFALYFNSYTTWLGKALMLDDLYVEEVHRKEGVGRELFKAVAKIAYELPGQQMDFHVLSWNPAIEFYKRMGALDLSESETWRLFRLDSQRLKDLVS